MPIAADTVAQDAFAVTKSDSTPLDFTALYVGTTGDVAIRTFRGTTVTFPSVPAGGYVLCRGDRVMSTNTTASGIVGLKF